MLNLTGQEILLCIIFFETPKSGQMLCWNFTMYSEKSPALQREMKDEEEKFYKAMQHAANERFTLSQN